MCCDLWGFLWEDLLPTIAYVAPLLLYSNTTVPTPKHYRCRSEVGGCLVIELALCGADFHFCDILIRPSGSASIALRQVQSVPPTQGTLRNSLYVWLWWLHCLLGAGRTLQAVTDKHFHNSFGASPLSDMAGSAGTQAFFTARSSSVVNHASALGI